MILGVDHISLSTDDLDRSLEALTDLGYRPSWVERDLPQSRQLKPAVRQFRNSQSIAFCRHPQGVPVELTHHGLTDNRTPPYHSLIKGPPAESSPHRRADERLLDEAWKQAGLPTEGASNQRPIIEGTPSTTFTPSGAIQAIGLVVPFLDQSVSFWIDGLGCRQKSWGALPTGERWALLNFREETNQQSLRVLLVEGPVRAELPMLDDRGLTCVALLTTDIEEDFAWAARHARETVALPFDVDIHGRRFRVGLVRGPAGEIIELMQPN